MVVDNDVDERQTVFSMPVYQAVGKLSATTRHLCCAAYVDGGFANTVIREVVESERKAVPPSFGFDIDPVVRHCLRARRLLIGRYAVVTGLLVVGLVLAAGWTVAWLAVCATAIGMRSASVPRPVRRTVVALVVLFLMCGGVLPVLMMNLPQFADSPVGSGYSDYSSATPDLDTIAGAGGSGFSAIVPLMLAAAMVATLFLSRRHAYGIITTELAPDAPASAPRTGNSRIEWRLDAVAAMQRGNIGVHDVDPFAGAGWLEHRWSFTVPLTPKANAGDDDAERRRRRIRLDTGALDRAVENAILALRGSGLSDGERIPGLYVVPYVAADGHRRTDDPLIDEYTRTPRTQAAPETLAAIRDCPQGGLRHYLRAVVPVDGKEIRTEGGLPVLPPHSSGIGVTAFIHFAVEGGMLYAEFVATVMPQVRGLYQVGDNLRPERVPARAARDTAREFLRDNLMGPVHLARIGWDAIRLNSRMERAGRAADEFRHYDFGARFSVRELAAEWPTVKFMQRLDAQKYVALLDRTVSEAIVSFLDERGVDTDEFRTAVTNVLNDYSSHHNNSGGQQVYGDNNKVTQRNRTERGGRSGDNRG
jgi:hypothetical protein